MSAFAVIATRNEALTIGRLVATLIDLGLTVIVEDESDTMDTVAAAYLTAGRAFWTPGSQRTGLGPSLMRAWKRALEMGATEIVQLDAGGSHDPNDAPQLLAALERYDFVVGSRFCPGACYAGNPKRAALSRLAATLCSLKSGHHFTDWTSGYRAMRAQTARYLLSFDYQAKMHAWQIEVLAHAALAPFTIAELPIAYTAGRSAFNSRVALEAYHIWRML